jgi:hypothetical protein
MVCHVREREREKERGREREKERERKREKERESVTVIPKIRPMTNEEEEEGSLFPFLSIQQWLSE